MYAKTLVMANSKFVGRVTSLQIDINTGATDFYKLILKHSSTTIPDDVIEKLIFKFNPPRSLNTMNMIDLVNNADQVVQAMIKAVTGENSDPGEDGNKIKDFMYLNLMKEMLPMLDWDSADRAYESAKISLAKKKNEPKVTSNEDSSY